MPMIALSPVWWSWQKTTCSWSAGPGRPVSLWGIANTLVTVATLLVPSRLLVGPGSEPSVLRPAGPLAGSQGMPAGTRRARCVPYRPVTDGRDDVVISTAAFATFRYVTIRQ